MHVNSARDVFPDADGVSNAKGQDTFRDCPRTSVTSTNLGRAGRAYGGADEALPGLRWRGAHPATPSCEVDRVLMPVTESAQ